MVERARTVTDVGYRVTATTAKHTWYADAPEVADGEDSAPNPEEMLLGALGSCTVQTLHMYANRKQWDLQRVEVNLEFDKQLAKDVPDYDGDAKFVHHIRKDIRLFGELDDAQRERLMDIAEKCPVNRILLGPTHVTKDTLLPIEED